MRRLVFVSLYLGLAVIIIHGCATISITEVSPERGLPGTIVTIRGNGFDTNPFNNTVTIGGSTTRVISGDANRLRVIALRDLVTGPVVVQASSGTAISLNPFRREGSTVQATPLVDGDAELIEGQGYDVDKRYDMTAQGLNQKILVVLTTPSDINPEDLAPAGKTARQSVIDRLAQVNTYFIQASYNRLSVDIDDFDVTPSWIPLSQIRDFYCWQQEDINRAQANLDALMLDPTAQTEQIEEARSYLNTTIDSKGFLQQPDFLFAEALIGARAVMPFFDSYSDYFVVVAGPYLRGQNYGAQAGYHAESTTPEEPIGLFYIDFVGEKGITYVAQEADWGRMVHELSHFFAIGDVYSKSYADGSFTAGTAAPFAMMGNHNSYPLYIGYNIETRLNYFTGGINMGSNVRFLEWGEWADFDGNFDIVAHAKTEDPTGNFDFHLLRLKVTDGLSYYVEVRQKPDPSLGNAADYVFDPLIPLGAYNPSWKGGVIIYKAVENNNQTNNNEREVSLVPPGRMLQVGDSFEDPARTIRISVVQKLADRPAKYRVRVEWGHLPAADPNGQFDLRIKPWRVPSWETEDIWVNSIKNDETTPPIIIYKNHEDGDETIPVGNGDPPWVGHANTIFARITNQGMVETPEAVKVTFYVNSPPGVGDNGNWTPFSTVDVGQLAAGQTKVVAAERWRPRVGEHTCVKVQIHPQTGEVTFDNNFAQENFMEFETGASSPYAPVEFDFLARNPYDSPGVMDLQAHKVPADWFVAFNHGSVWLHPKEEKKVHVVIWTDRAAEWTQDVKAPRKPIMSLEGRMDKWGDQVFAVGGMTAFVQAVRFVEVQIGETRKDGKVGQPFFVAGGVTPATGIVPIAIHITDPDGRLITEISHSTNAGQISYQTRYEAEKAGEYQIQAFVLGGSLAAEAESPIYEVLVQ